MQGGENGVKRFDYKEVSWVFVVLSSRKAKLRTRLCEVRIAGGRTGVAVLLLQPNHSQRKSLLVSREIQTWVLFNFACL